MLEEFRGIAVPLNKLARRNACQSLPRSQQTPVFLKWTQGHLAKRCCDISAVLLLALLGACQEARPPLLPVAAPDTKAYEKSVQSAVEKAHTAFDRIAAEKPTNLKLANAYGELAMVHHAQDLASPAEAAYKNARLLAPGDKRWPYLLGHLYNDTARQTEAMQSFEAVLKIDGNDALALLSLGEVALAHGDFERAQQVFDKLQQDKAARPAALAGLGKVALAKRDYNKAVAYLQESLQLWPSGSKLRHPLAVAYQALGERDKAAQALRAYSANGQEPSIPDPLADALGAKAASSRSLLRRGQRYGQTGQFDLARQAFEAAAQADPKNAEILANLGISLANLGQLEAAQKSLTESLHIDDTNATAQMSLAVVYDRQGLDQEASVRYRAAIERDGKNVQARVYLADARMRAGQALEAAPLYREAFGLSPSARIRLSLSYALLRSGQFAEARKQLEAGLAEDGRNQSIANALARVLASAPDASLRDGQRAVSIAKPLFEATKSPEAGQTFAMAMAETGDFDQAVKLQQETLIVYDRMGAPGMKPFLERNLTLYQQKKPSREPWSATDSVFQPRSPAVSLKQ